jgi:putative DNA primase/helicase
MSLSPEELSRIAADQQRINEQQIRLHGREMLESGRSLVELPTKTDWRSALTRRGKVFIGDERNVSLSLRLAPELAGLLRFNEFSERVEVTRQPPWRSFDDGPSWSSADDVGLKVFLQERDIDCRSTSVIAETVEFFARERRWHPLRNRLLSIRWDGNERIKGWIRDYLNSPDDPLYLRDVGIAWLVGAVARVFNPGVQVDNVLTLIGRQGDGKSETARILALDPEFFLGDLPDLRNKDSQLVLRGRWIIELAELAAIRRADIESVKSFITQRIDVVRPPYGRRTVTIPRQCVFLATSNTEFFLRDRTGNRRWWPVSVGKIDLPLLRKDVEQLWGEAILFYQSGHPWHLEGDALERAESAQADRVELTEIDVAVKNYLDNVSSDSITTRDVLRDALNLDPTSATYAEQAKRHGTDVRNAIIGAGWEFSHRKGRTRDRTYTRKGRPG